YQRAHLHNTRYPTRLIFVLPRRALVEQTAQRFERWIAQLGLTVPVYILMGKSTGDRSWHLSPEQPAVIIGTQDMVLSRALGRGYGASPGRWPIDMGLFNSDCLYVFDEVQLMGPALATAIQLSVARGGAWAPQRPCYTWLMSATLSPRWFEQLPELRAWREGAEELALADDDRGGPLWRGTKRLTLEEEGQSLGAGALINRSQQLFDGLLVNDPNRLHLAIFNTVKGAQEAYSAVLKELPRAEEHTAVTDWRARFVVRLLHSRFTPADRARLMEEVLALTRGAEGKVVLLISTQVVEAGVDLSAHRLSTQLCPWPSLVQRLGRLARRGGDGGLFVETLADLKKQSAPYETAELEACLRLLSDLVAQDRLDLGLCGLAELRETLAQRPELYAAQSAPPLRADELRDLFDTSVDLTGGYTDVSRYIRDAEESEVLVGWSDLRQEEAPASDLRPNPAHLCQVSLSVARKLFGKPKEPWRGWAWDYVAEEWRALHGPRSPYLRPGARVLLARECGGYSADLGLLASESAASTPRRALEPVTAEEMCDSGEEADALSVMDAREGRGGAEGEESAEGGWQTIAEHGAAVGEEAMRLASELGLNDELQRLLGLAGRWHDYGKAHILFQSRVDAERASALRADWAKAPQGAWRAPRGDARGFRHELASALALFALVERFCPPEDEKRLGEFGFLASGGVELESREGRALVEEVAGLNASQFNLLVYLVASHHGKVRARLSSTRHDQQRFERSGALCVRGVTEGDSVGEVEMRTSAGRLERCPALSLSLEPSALGLSTRTGASWVERVERLLSEHGPFRLTFLESILRAADVRCSRLVEQMSAPSSARREETV
ncbi:MAG: CRISPR-associated endonuclease Cas3'', partial [Deltaproteobacteria bacterium]|nr:CRISPR-associated endonuclease Cas3'' [Deltaproteobacteria bacterium]